MYFSSEDGDDSLGGRLNFLKFETDNIDACIEFVRKLQADQKQKNDSKSEDLCVMATGGGAFKYYDRLTEALGVEVIREDEMECLIIGMIAFHSGTPEENANLLPQVSTSSSTRSRTKFSRTAKKAP